MVEKSRFIGQLNELYPFQLVWIDWGLLSYLLKLSSNNPSNYDLNTARANLKSICPLLTAKFGITNPKLILGFQLLEAGKNERKDILIELWKEFDYPIFLMPVQTGHRLSYIGWTLLEIFDRFFHFSNNSEIKPDIYKKFRQYELANGYYDKLQLPDNSVLVKENAKALGSILVDTITQYRSIYNKSEFGKVYEIENKAYSVFFKELVSKFPETFGIIKKLKNISDSDFPKYIQEFLESEYYETLELPKIWSNIFSSWMVKTKELALTVSDRGDLMGLLEIGLFADVGFVDKRTLNTWQKRFNKDCTLTLFSTGELSKFF